MQKGRPRPCAFDWSLQEAIWAQLHRLGARKGVFADEQVRVGPISVCPASFAFPLQGAWHYHPGYVMTVVKQGTLTVEDGCGGEEVYVTGQAFEEIPGRVHRGKNLGTEEVQTIQTFILSEGLPTTVQIPGNQPLCGPPLTLGDCRDGGWMNFNQPRSFGNQGDCEQYVKTGR